MLPQERHNQILEKLRLEGQVRVRQLATDFNVTEDCIRKDLAILSRQHKLQRIHGGAIPLRENVHALQTDDRHNLREKEKQEIAHQAIRLIHEGMTIFLDISSINLELAKLLYAKKLPVTIVTNMTDIMKIFSAPSSVAKLFFIGGTFNHAMDGFTGTLTIDLLRRFRFDAAFMGAIGINLVDKTVTTYDPDDGLTKQTAMYNSTVCYLLAEKDKLFLEGNFVYASPDQFALWICDQPLNEQEEALAKESSLNVQNKEGVLPFEKEESIINDLMDTLVSDTTENEEE